MKRCLLTILVACAAAGAVEVNQAYLPIFMPPLPKRIENPQALASPEKIELGRMLFYDTRLSAGQDISCNSCHVLEKYGVDGQKLSPGNKKQPQSRNTPTVYNTAGHIAQFWDGRVPTVEEQAVVHVLDPKVMGMPGKEYVAQVIKSIPGYADAFKKAFPEDPE